MAILEKIIGIIAPLECLVCQEQGQALCEICAMELVEPLPSRCFRCLKRTDDFRTCKTCNPKARLLHVWPASEYNEQLAVAIKKFKYERNRALARPLAGIIRANLPYFSKTPLIVPIPTATSRARQRGYDHTLLLARALSELTGWPMVEHLRRTTQARQVGSKRHQRIEQLKGAFTPIRTELLRGKSVILVDDVVTTGSTLAEAALVLRQNGARTVSAATIAHKS